MSHTAEHLRLLEAIVFASAKPVTEAELARFLPEDADVAAAMAELAQHYQGQVTIARLVAQLGDLGFAISKRQVVRLLSDGQKAFLEEDAGVLRAGLTSAAWISVDDTGARLGALRSQLRHDGGPKRASEQKDALGGDPLPKPGIGGAPVGI